MKSNYMYYISICTYVCVWWAMTKTDSVFYSYGYCHSLESEYKAYEKKLEDSDVPAVLFCLSLSYKHLNARALHIPKWHGKSTLISGGGGVLQLLAEHTAVSLKAPFI